MHKLNYWRSLEQIISGSYKGTIHHPLPGNEKVCHSEI